MEQAAITPTPRPRPRPTPRSIKVTPRERRCVSNRRLLDCLFSSFLRVTTKETPKLRKAFSCHHVVRSYPGSCRLATCSRNVTSKTHVRTIALLDPQCEQTVSLFNATKWIFCLGGTTRQVKQYTKYGHCMMTSSNGNIFRVTGPLCGEFTGPGEFPAQRPVTRSFDVFFDQRLNKRLNKQPPGWWLRRHCGHYDVIVMGFGLTHCLSANETTLKNVGCSIDHKNTLGTHDIDLNL